MSSKTSELTTATYSSMQTAMSLSAIDMIVSDSWK